LRPARQRARKGESMATALGTSVRKAPRRFGAYVVHLGVIVTFVAISISATFQTSREGIVRAGAPLEIAGYTLTLDRVAVEEESHRAVQKAVVGVARHGHQEGVLEPSLNHYPTMAEPIGTPAVRTTFTHDLYLTLMNVRGRDEVGLRAIVTPAVVWIWIGVFIMTLGTGLCLIDPAGRRPAAGARTAEA